MTLHPMSSFVRSYNHKQATGRLSTGIEDLDRILGEDVIRGTSILILEDENSQIHSTMLRVFLSEGVSNGEDVMVVVKERVDTGMYEAKRSMKDVDSDRMVIAWRYSNTSPRMSRFKFNLSRKIPFEGISISGEEATLENILETLGKRNGLRVSIFSLLSPMWNYPSHSDSELVNFFSRLKKAIRLNNHVCMISIPGFLRDNLNYSLYFDTVMILDSHLLSGFCPNYNGILEFKRIVEYKGPRVNYLGSMKYGMKIRKEEIRVEKIDIPPVDVISTESCTASETF